MVEDYKKIDMYSAHGITYHKKLCRTQQVVLFMMTEKEPFFWKQAMDPIHRGTWDRLFSEMHVTSKFLDKKVLSPCS